MTARLRSLGTRLRLQFLLLGILPVLALFGVAWALMAPVLVAQAEERNRELALSVRDQIGLQLDVRQRAASVLADGLRTGGTPLQAQGQGLQALIREDRFLQAAFLTDASDRVIEAALSADSGRYAEDALGLDLSRQDHLRRARASQTPVWSDAYLSTLTGQVTAALAVPAGERTVLLELSLQALSTSVRDLAQSGSTVVVIVDRAGHVIAHPDAGRALRRESLWDLPLVRAALDGGEGRGRRTEEGAEQLSLALPVPPIGWAVVVSQPLAVVMAPIWRLGGALAAVLILTLSLAMLAGWRMARRTSIEVGRLADGAQRAAASGLPSAELSFSTAEFDAVWTRLRELFRQLHQRDEQTRAAQSDLQAVLDAATQVAIVATDCNGLVTVFNVGAQRMFGWLPGEVLGRLTPLAWHDETEVARRGQELSRRHGQDIAGVEALFVEARHSGYEVRDWRLRRRDGSVFDVSLAITAMRTPAGELKGFLGVAVDITERRRAAELEVARKTAELANGAKSLFLSKMSHELRTPLNAILGFAQLLEADAAHPPGDVQRERMQHIQHAGWHLVRLIDDMLDLARIEAGQVRMDIGSVELGPMLARAAQLVASRMAEHGVRLIVDIELGTPARVVCDETRLVQVLVNLLGNAAKYNRRGGEVRLGCGARGDELHIGVSDTGLGMTAEQLSHLYEPFNRLGQEGSGIEGTGIGLVITQHLVGLMQGRLEVSSERGQGTRFVVVLPLNPAVAEAAGPAPAAAPGAALPPPARGRVLYIEDNEVNAQLMRAMLRQRPNVELRICAQADSGLAEARAWRPQLLLLDMHLPDARGDEVLRQWRADPALRSVPVVIVSADATQSQIASMLEQGAQAYITKPLELQQTLRTIDDLLGEPATATAAAAR